MTEYKKAEQLSLGDKFWRISCGSLIEQEVTKLEKIKDVIRVNGIIYFKKKGSKGYLVRSNLQDWEVESTFNNYEKEEKEDSTIYATDIRIVNTKANNYFVFKIEESKNVIQNELDKIQKFSTEMAKFR